MAEKQSPKKAKKKLPRKEYILLNDETVGDKEYKKGDPILLTHEGMRYFKRTHKIR